MFDEKSRLQSLAYQRLIDNGQLEFSCRNCSGPTHGARFCDDDCEAEYMMRKEAMRGEVMVTDSGGNNLGTPELLTPALKIASAPGNSASR